VNSRRHTRFREQPVVTYGMKSNHAPRFAPAKNKWLLPFIALGLASLVTQLRALPNVIVILVDDMGYGDTTLYGTAVVATPKIKSIANNGVLFTQGYAASPACLPSRAALMVSMYPERMGMVNNTVGASHYADMPSGQTIASLLKTKGYQTVAIGKWHLGDVSGLFPGGRGFDQFFGFYGGLNSFYRTSAPADAVHLDANNNVLIGGTIVVQPGQAIKRNGNAVTENSHLTDAFTREAIDYIDAHAADPEPFFMYLAYNAPHVPLQCPKSYYDKYPGIADPRKRIHAGMIDQLDKSIGDVLTKLTDMGIANNTLVIFASDNGAPLAANAGVNLPLRGGKHEVFEGGVRIPFAMKWPGTYTAGTVHNRPVSLMDILPTACVAAGFSQDTLVNTYGINGVNLTPLINSPLTTDNFDDGNFTGWTQYNGSWSVTSGKLNCVPGVSEGKLMINTTTMTDFAYDADIKVAAGPAGLVFSATNVAGGTNSYNGYRVVLKTAENQLQIVRVDNGSATVLATSSFTVNTATTYRMRVVVEGSLIQVYIDDMITPKATATDATYGNGRFGVCGSTNTASATFDNVVISPRDILAWNYLTENGSDLHSAVREGDFKYITIDDLSGNVSEELYNIPSDAGEATNLAGNGAYAATLQRLRDLLTQWELEN
jgi:arylsulfatase A-like enzyme